MVKIRDLRKRYNALEVVRGLNMNIEKGDVYGFLGKNGCGKTTTMSILCNIIPKDSGEIYLGNGNEKLKIGYLPETPTMYGYMNAVEYLEYIAACCNYNGNVKDRIDNVLNIVGMSDRAKYRIKTYSRGMNQRIGIAAALFNHPDLLVLDEPTSALDPQGRADVMEIIQKLHNDGCTIILCTHILSDVERVATKIGIMNGGIMVEEGTISQILTMSKVSGIELSLFGNNWDKVNRIKTIDFAEKVEFDEKTGKFIIQSANVEECAGKLLNFLSQNEIIPQTFRVMNPTLEEIYLKAVN